MQDVSHTTYQNPSDDGVKVRSYIFTHELIAKYD
jgi:hypothetical protein